MSDGAFSSGLITGVGLCALLFSNPYDISGSDIAKLRLAERKVCQKNPEQREGVFMMKVVPKFGLQEDSFEYKVLKTVCMTGVYGSNPSDFNVGLDNVRVTYDMCGWTLPEIKTPEKK